MLSPRTRRQKHRATTSKVWLVPFLPACGRGANAAGQQVGNSGKHASLPVICSSSNTRFAQDRFALPVERALGPVLQAAGNDLSVKPRPGRLQMVTSGVILHRKPPDQGPEKYWIIGIKKSCRKDPHLSCWPANVKDLNAGRRASDGASFTALLSRSSKRGIIYRIKTAPKVPLDQDSGEIDRRNTANWRPRRCSSSSSLIAQVAPSEPIVVFS